jgi:hypothetical protein
MKQKPDMEQQLWNYIDGFVSSEEKSSIERQLESNLEWKNKYHEFLQTSQLLKSSELDQPSLRFTKNVMDTISKYQIAPAAKNYINNRIIWGIGSFFILMIVGFLVYAFAQVNWASGTESKYKVDLPSVDFSPVFSNTWVNAFMMVNIVIGLALLDRILANKRKQFRERNSMGH